MKIRKKTILIFLFLLPFMQPDYFENIPTLARLYDILKVLVMLTFFMFFGYKRKYSKIIIGIGLFEFLHIIVSFINNYNLVSSITFGLSTISFLMIIEYYLHKDLKSLISALLFHFEILVYINLISIILFPNGIFINLSNYPVWFLGIDNVHIFVLLPALCISMLRCHLYVKGFSLRNFLCLFAIAIQIIIRWSASAMVGFLLIVIYFIFRKQFNNYKIFNFRNYLLVIIGLFFGIVVFRIQNIFEFLIVDILGKNLTFTGRIYIWDYVMNLISESPLLGYGPVPILNIPFPNYLFNAEHAHNLILNILYNGGVLLFSIFIYINILLIKKLMKYDKNFFSMFLSFLIFVCYIIFLTEVNNLKFIFIIFVFAYNVKALVSAKEKGISRVNEKFNF